jgi:hypothetical protein
MKDLTMNDLSWHLARSEQPGAASNVPRLRRLDQHGCLER